MIYHTTKRVRDEIRYTMFTSGDVLFAMFWPTYVLETMFRVVTTEIGFCGMQSGKANLFLNYQQTTSVQQIVTPLRTNLLQFLRKSALDSFKNYAEPHEKYLQQQSDQYSRFLSAELKEDLNKIAANLDQLPDQVVPEDWFRVKRYKTLVFANIFNIGICDYDSHWNFSKIINVFEMTKY